jgi:uncharacterized RDD family membrane protein YckC
MPYCTKCGKLIADDTVFCPYCGAPSQVKGSAAPTTPPPGVPVSGIDAVTKSKQAQDYWIRRAVAMVIDYVVIAFILGIFVAIIFVPYAISQVLTGGFFNAAQNWFNVISFPLIIGVGLILYFPISEVSWGVTLGKSIMGLKVTNINGDRPTLGQAFIRNISKIYWILLLLDVIVGLAVQTDYKQKYSDKYAGTIVVSTR